MHTDDHMGPGNHSHMFMIRFLIRFCFAKSLLSTSSSISNSSGSSMVILMYLLRLRGLDDVEPQQKVALSYRQARARARQLFGRHLSPEILLMVLTPRPRKTSRGI